MVTFRSGAKVGFVASVVLLTACSGPTAGPDESTKPTTAVTGPSVPGDNVALPPFPAQPEGVPWPTTEWTVAELPEGVDRIAIDEATDIAIADGGPERVRAVVIVHRGAIVYERYSPAPSDGPDVEMPSHSIAKSVTAAMIGILVRDGRLALEQPAPVPEWHEEPDDPRAAITLDNMLHMSTGMEWTDGLDPGTTMSEMVATNDMAAYAASQTLTWDPGQMFDYNTGTTTLLARIIGEEINGGKAELRAFMDDELFDVIGMNPVNISFDGAGTWLGGFSADTTARNFAKFGLLHVRGGMWDGERVLPEWWVEFMRTPSSTNPEYGAHWWLDTERPGVFYAIGVKGQVVTVDPAHDLVIVQLSTVGGELPLAQTETILNAFAAAQGS